MKYHTWVVVVVVVVVIVGVVVIEEPSLRVDEELENKRNTKYEYTDR